MNIPYTYKLSNSLLKTSSFQSILKENAAKQFSTFYFIIIFQQQKRFYIIFSLLKNQESNTFFYDLVDFILYDMRKILVGKKVDFLFIYGKKCPQKFLSLNLNNNDKLQIKIKMIKTLAIKIILFLALFGFVINTIPNCAFASNNVCSSCFVGWQLSAGRCDNCRQDYIMVNNICLDQYSYSQMQNAQTIQSTSTTSSNNIDSSWSSQGTGNVVSINTNYQSSNPVIQNTISTQSGLVTQNNLNFVTSNSGASSTNAITFDISNSGVMYLLQLFGLNVKIPQDCQIFTSDFNCQTCRSGYRLTASGSCSIISSSSSTQTTSGSSSSGSSTSGSSSSSSSNQSSQSSTFGSSSNQISQTSNQNTGINGGAFLVNNDAFCKQFTNGICSECYYRYYLNSQLGYCVPVNPQCKTWNNQGSCLSCYSGYSISGSQCVVDFYSNSQTTNSGSTSTSSNSGSSTTTGSTTISGSTSNSGSASNFGSSSNSGSSFNGGSASSFGSNANSGWSSGSGSSSNSGSQTSSFSNQVSSQKYDLNCNIQNVDGSCSQCYSSFYYDSINFKKCVAVNPLCKTWNNLGYCLSCYQGYNLISNTCVIQNAYIPSIQVGINDLPLSDQDPNCNTYKDRVCVKCAARTYMDPVSKRCTQVDGNCRSWNDLGICQQCYSGYEVFNLRQCRSMYPQVNIPRLKSDLNTDVNCLASDQNGRCTGCIFRYVLNSSTRICMKVNDLCKTWNQTTALCTGCYGGYSLTSNGQCRVSW